jgi:hypothetical protein
MKKTIPHEQNKGYSQIPFPGACIRPMADYSLEECSTKKRVGLEGALALYNEEESGNANRLLVGTEVAVLWLSNCTAGCGLKVT